MQSAMEKSRLPPELQLIVDRLSKFRNEYSMLKTHYAAQEELINLQKMELEKMNLRVDQLASALVDYHRRFKSTMHHLESENQRLQKIIDTMKRDYERSRDNENEFVRQIQRKDDEENVLENDEHREPMETIEEHNNNEIPTNKDKPERVYTSKNRSKLDLDTQKEKLDDSDRRTNYRNALITQQEKKHKSNTVHEAIVKNNGCQYSHPALGNVTTNNGNKRNQSISASYRWPQLEVHVKKEKEIAQKSGPAKKKKLYLADDEAIVDLTL